jgi:hypothetical protein
MVGRAAAGDDVLAAAREDVVPVGAAAEDVVAEVRRAAQLPAEETVEAGAAVDEVVVEAAVGVVVARSGQHRVLVLLAVERVGALEAEDGVVAAVAPG